jgi:uncharacterized protein YuzE
MSAKHRIEVRSKTPPVVELDSNAHAAYIRFSKAKVAKTEIIACDREVITADLAKDGSLIGIELVGVNEFTISSLMKATGVHVPQEMLDNTRYVSAKRSGLAFSGN